MLKPFVLICVLGFCFFNLCNCEDKNSISHFQLEGKWKEVKGNSIFDKARREAVYEIQRLGDVYTGRMISLDNALDHQNQIRSCFNCSEESEILLGLALLRGLKQKKDGIYYGEFYDVYNRKWFDIKITPISKDQITIRTYAIFPVFGRNILWERGEEYYKNILKSEPVHLQENKQYYALEIGSVDYAEKNLVHLINSHNAKLQPRTPIYFFSKQGKLISGGSVLQTSSLEILIQAEQSQNVMQAIPVIFFDRTHDWSAKN